MSTVRRGLLLAAATAVVVMTTLSLTPAHAMFSDSAGGGTTISTGSVAAPANVVGSLSCGLFTATMRTTWTASTSDRVSGYLVTRYYSGGGSDTIQVASTATNWSDWVWTWDLGSRSVQFSVTTQTNYGWTQESPRTGWFHC